MHPVDARVYRRQARALERRHRRLSLPGSIAGVQLPRAVFEHVDPLLKLVGNHLDAGLTRGLVGAEIDDRLQERRAADGKADEARHGGGDAEPLDDLLLVLAAAQHNRADAIATVAAYCLDDLHAVFAAVQPFDLPDVRLDAEVLNFADRTDHQAGAHLQIVRLLAAGLLELVGLGGHQHLEHVQPVVLMQVVGQPLQSLELPAVELSVALGIVAHQHLGEGWIELLDVFGKVIAILKVEFVLAALFGRHGDVVAIGASVAENGGAEFFVDQDARLVFGSPRGHGLFIALVNDLLAIGNDGGLLGTHRLVKTEHLVPVRVAMVERQDV